jgi:hypothetical protein
MSDDLASTRPDETVLAELIRVLQAEGLDAELVDGAGEVVVRAADPRLDPWDDPTADRRIEVVRIVHRDGHLHCPWLAGPVPDADVEELGDMLTTLMQSRGY